MGSLPFASKIVRSRKKGAAMIHIQSSLENLHLKPPVVAHSPSPPPDEGVSSKFTILVMEDNLVTSILIQKQFKSLLERLQCPGTVDFATDGFSGWNLCEKKIFDYYVVDQHMPTPDGKELLGDEVCRRIVELNPLGTVVLFTSIQQDEIDILKLPAGVTRLEKKVPVLVKHLEEKVTEFKRKNVVRRNSFNGEPQ